VERIYDTLLKLFEMAAADHLPTSLMADRLAEQRLQAGRKTAHTP